MLGTAGTNLQEIGPPFHSILTNAFIVESFVIRFFMGRNADDIREAGVAHPYILPLLAMDRKKLASQSRATIIGGFGSAAPE